MPKKHYFAQIPTIAIFIAFAISGPLGLLLFILKHIDKDSLKKEQANAAYASDFRASDTRPGAQAQPAAESPLSHDFPTAEQKKAKERQKSMTTLCAVVGAVFLLAGVNGMFIKGPGGMAEMFRYLAQMLGGGGALWLSTRMSRTRKLERQLDKIVADRDNIPLEELFAAAGVDAAKGRAAVESAIEHGYFGADAYIDNRTGTLVVRGPAPQPPTPPQPEPTPEP